MSENRPEVNLYKMTKLLKGQSITLLHTRRVQSSSFKETQQSSKVNSEEERRGEEELYISITKSASLFLGPEPGPLELSVEIASQFAFDVRLKKLVWTF